MACTIKSTHRKKKSANAKVAQLRKKGVKGVKVVKVVKQGKGYAVTVC